jgi:hypothetical protein
LTELKGSEKQVKFAKDLMEKIRKYTNYVVDAYTNEHANEDLEEFFELLTDSKDFLALKSEQRASVIINKVESFCKNELWHLEDEELEKEYISKEGESYGKYLIALLIEDKLVEFFSN